MAAVCTISAPEDGSPVVVTSDASACCIDSGTSHCHNRPMSDDIRYSLAELADLAGVTPRTVRYYLSQGLLPARRATRSGREVRRGSPRSAPADPPAPARPPAARGDPPAAGRARRCCRPGPGRDRRRARAGRLRARLHPAVLGSPRPTTSRPASFALPVSASTCRTGRPGRPDHPRRIGRPVTSPSPATADRALPVGTHRPRSRRRAPRPPAFAPDPEQAGRPSRDDRPRAPRGGPDHDHRTHQPSRSDQDRHSSAPPP